MSGRNRGDSNRSMPGGSGLTRDLDEWRNPGPGPAPGHWHGKQHRGEDKNRPDSLELADADERGTGFIDTSNTIAKAAVRGMSIAAR